MMKKPKIMLNIYNIFPAGSEYASLNTKKPSCIYCSFKNLKNKNYWYTPDFTTFIYKTSANT